MCVGITVTLAPPTFLAAGYCLWITGQNFALRRLRIDVDTPPQQTMLSYSAGIITLSAMFIGQDRFIQQMEASASPPTGTTAVAAQQSKDFLPHKAPHQAFRPPQTIQELMERLGPPLLSRLGAASFSFFCAGVVQTYVANSLQPRLADS